MRSLSLSKVAVAVGLVVAAASACSSDAPTLPSQQPTAPATSLRGIVLEAPSVINIGDTPVAIPVRVELGDGSFVSLDKVKCSATWTSSEPAIATVSLGLLEARSIGDVTIALACREVRAEKLVRVRRRLTGTVLARYDNEPVANAAVSVVSGPDAGTETHTDNAGRFMLSVPSAFELQASAAEFDPVRRTVEPAQGDVQLTLEPSLLTFRWEGGFEPNPPYSNRRVPAGTLDGFEFTTHHTAEFTLGLYVGCGTSGTYDSLDAVLSRGGAVVMFVSPWRPFAMLDRRSMKLPPGRYSMTFSASNAYAKPGCVWQLELTRPY